MATTHKFSHAVIVVFGHGGKFVLRLRSLARLDYARPSAVKDPPCSGRVKELGTHGRLRKRRPDYQSLQR